jgi:hypothetical protein
MDDNILANLVRVGTVYAVDDGRRLARVRFDDKGLTSAWLPVLKSPPFIPSREESRTEYESGGSGDAAYASHKHDLIIKPWMPSVNDTVLCLYIPTFNGDGYVLGAI